MFALSLLIVWRNLSVCAQAPWLLCDADTIRRPSRMNTALPAPLATRSACAYCGGRHGAHAARLQSAAFAHTVQSVGRIGPLGLGGRDARQPLDRPAEHCGPLAVDGGLALTAAAVLWSRGPGARVLGTAIGVVQVFIPQGGVLSRFKEEL